MRKADNLTPSCADVKKSGGLNYLEPCGLVQACNGTALPFLHEPSLFLTWLKEHPVPWKTYDEVLLIIDGEESH